MPRCAPLLLLAVLALPACNDVAVTDNNTAPEALILEPAPGASALVGAEVDFAGEVTDRRTPLAELEVFWSSSLDGDLWDGLAGADGATAFATDELSAGEHTITLQVRDAEGATGAATTTLTVAADGPPSLVIDSPEPASAWPDDAPVVLAATVSDDLDDPADLRVDWVASDGTVLVDGAAPDSVGVVSDAVTLTPGPWIIEATVTDTAGNTRTASVSFTVTAPNSAPTCALTAPASNTAVASGASVLFEGTVDDADQVPNTLAVSLSSSLDGPLPAASANSAGDVALAWDGLSAGTHTVTLEAVDDAGASRSDFVLLTVGSPPAVSIDAPAVGDPLDAGVPFGAEGTVADADEPAAGLTVAWSSDLDGALGSSTPDGAGAVAATLALTAGTHVLTLSATDADGAIGTDSVTLTVNAAPTAPVVAIDPDPAATGDDLVAQIATASIDADGPNAVTYTYAWTRDGSPMGPYSPPDTVPSSETAAGDLWAVTVFASDGQASSPGASASVTVGNSPPSLAGVAIDPPTAHTDTTLTALVSGWFDADGDPQDVDFQWFAGGNPVGSNAATLDGSAFAKGDAITVEATPVDASSSGTPVLSSPVPILNTPPEAPAITLTPGSPVETDDLTCAVATPSFDLDGDGVTYAFSWSDGVTTQAGDVLSSSFTAPGDTWTCTAVPNDGEADGAAATGSVSVSAASNCTNGGPSPNTCAPNCDAPSACLYNYGSLDCAPPVITDVYFTNCSSIGFVGATYCWVVEGSGFQESHTTQNGNMHWGSSRQGVGLSNTGGNWNWLFDDLMVATVGFWYVDDVGDEFWIVNPDGQRSDCLTIGWQ